MIQYQCVHRLLTGQTPITKARLKVLLREAANLYPEDLERQELLGELQAFVDNKLSEEALAKLDPESPPLPAWGWVKAQRPQQASGEVAAGSWLDGW